MRLDGAFSKFHQNFPETVLCQECELFIELVLHLHYSFVHCENSVFYFFYDQVCMIVCHAIKNLVLIAYVIFHLLNRVEILFHCEFSKPNVSPVCVDSVACYFSGITHLPLAVSDIRTVRIHFGPSGPVIFLHMTTEFGKKIRGLLGVFGCNSGVNYDPGSLGK
jgi:hypothetical protein